MKLFFPNATIEPNKSTTENPEENLPYPEDGNPKGGLPNGQSLDLNDSESGTDGKNVQFSKVDVHNIFTRITNMFSSVEKTGFE